MVRVSEAKDMHNALSPGRNRCCSSNIGEEHADLDFERQRNS
jgi:hypothetical protein